MKLDTYVGFTYHKISMNVYSQKQLFHSTQSNYSSVTIHTLTTDFVVAPQIQ